MKVIPENEGKATKKAGKHDQEEIVKVIKEYTPKISTE